MKRILRISIILMALLVLCQNTSFADGPVKKLGRGVANAVTGWAEIFTTIGRHWEDRGYLVGTFSGIPAGIGRAVWRTAAGVYETITFPFALPEGYEPIMEPEYVLDSSILEE